MAHVIYHVGAWNRNLGDWALHFVIQRQLQALAGVPLEFRDLDSQQVYFDDYLIEEINRDGSLLLVGGGGLIFHRPEDKSRSGWQFNISKEGLDKLRIPLVVLAVGYNQFPHNPPSFPDRFIEHLSKTFRQAELSSVRNHGTSIRLESLGIPQEKTEVIMDPVSFCPQFDHSLPGLGLDGQRVVGINIAGDRPEQRFAYGREKVNHVWAQIAEVLGQIGDESNVAFGLIPHISDLDRDSEIIAILRARIGSRYFEFDDVVRSYWPARDAGIPMLASIYNRCDSIIGMRGHAGILAFSQGKPFLYFGDHEKCRYFTEEIGEPSWWIPSSDPNCAEAINSHLRDQLATNHSTKLQKVKEDKYVVYEDFLKRMVDLL